jgi:hypothetical protein
MELPFALLPTRRTIRVCRKGVNCRSVAYQEQQLKLGEYHSLLCHFKTLYWPYYYFPNECAQIVSMRNGRPVCLSGKCA